MRTLIASILTVSAMGCRCSPTDPSAVTLRLKNTTNAAIFVDDTDDKLGLSLQRNVAGAWSTFEDTLSCACQACDRVCSGGCGCDGGTHWVRKVMPGGTFERTWNGVVQVQTPSSCAATCLKPENAPVDEPLNLKLCYQSEVLGLNLPDGGRTQGFFPVADQACVDKEFRIVDGVVEIGPKKGNSCTTQGECTGAGELCLSGSCTASCPANGFPVLGTGWALRIGVDDMGFFASSGDAGTGASISGDITSVVYQGGTMMVHLKRTTASGDILTAKLSVTLPMGNAAPLPQSGKVTVQLFDGTTASNPENYAVVIREATGALLFAADPAMSGTLLKAAQTAPFTVTFDGPLVGCRSTDCGKQLFYKTKFSSAPVESSLDPGKSVLLTVPQGAYRMLNVSSSSYAMTSCKLFDIRPFAIWRE